MKKNLAVYVLMILCIAATSCSPKPDTPEAPAPVEEVTQPTDTSPPVEDSTAADTSTPEPEKEEETVPPEGGQIMSMTLSSTAFENGEVIPVKHTCDGSDLSPELTWKGLPEGTQSLALIVDDPDAPVGTWVHWVIFNLPVDVTGIPEAVTGVGVEGQNDFQQTPYGGPCPPSGTHRYFFKLYALDTTLDLNPGSTKEQLLEAMEGHILDQAELMGTYSR